MYLHLVCFLRVLLFNREYTFTAHHDCNHYISIENTKTVSDILLEEINNYVGGRMDCHAIYSSSESLFVTV